jgi:RNA polymerase sigma factor (sigma-70 family)
VIYIQRKKKKKHMRKNNKDERIKWDLNDPTQSRRLNELSNQYKPLVTKIAMQMYRKMHNGCYWEDIISMANEGLALAMKNFNPEKSTMNFTQYVAYSIRNNILNCMCTDLHVVSLNSYAVGKMKERGESTFTNVRMDSITGETGGEESYSREGKYGMFYDDPNAGEVHPITKLINFIKSNFKEPDAELFFQVYGLNGHEECAANKIAKERKVTCGAISQRMKIMMNAIKNNEEIKESLASLL